jgi:hypothetical protein
MSSNRAKPVCGWLKLIGMDIRLTYYFVSFDVTHVSYIGTLICVSLLILNTLIKIFHTYFTDTCESNTLWKGDSLKFLFTGTMQILPSKQHCYYCQAVFALWNCIFFTKVLIPIFKNACGSTFFINCPNATHSAI